MFAGEVTWREAMDLTRELMSDPSSHTAAAAAGWSEPWPREAFVLADLFDAYAAGHFKNPKPYPRPSNQVAVRGRPEVTPERRRAIAAKLSALGWDELRRRAESN